MYADEIGGDGPHRYVLMCLVSLGDPGLTIFPTHRLLTGLDDERRVALREAIRRDWDVEEVAEDELEPAPDGARPRSATSTPTTAARCGSRSRTRRSPTPRCPASRPPTAGSTPR